MTNNYLKQDMTVYELAQFMIEYCASKEDLKQFATKEDLKLLEKRLTRKIDTNYISINKRIDLVS
jgi:hypothetical protein